MPQLVFSHGNGFPYGSYRQLHEIWAAAGWAVSGVERYGHDPRWPVTSNWPRLRDELLAHIDGLDAAAGPLVLVGHSLGGFLSLMAALRRPARVAALVMLDSPLIAGWRAHGVQVVKATRLIRRISPGRVSARRRQHWPSTADCQAHFAAKHVFARWAPGVLDDYVHAGTEPDAAGGVRLRFDRAVETRIYETLPHHLPALLRRHPLRCPAAFVAGTASAEVRQIGLAATRALCHGRLSWIEGSHLYPMEKPRETAEQVLALLAQLGLNPARTAATPP